MYYKVSLSLSLCTLAAFLIMGCQDHLQPPSGPTTINVMTLASGFTGLLGVETDGKGRVFVSEQGSGKNDGRISEVTPDGTVYPIVTGLSSQSNAATGDLDATDHLLYADGILYFLGPKGLYKLDMSTIKTGSAPIPASSLTPEYIQQWVIDYKFVNDTGESHLYNMTFGPDGAIYFADAAANAIIRRSKTGQLSVMAEVPDVANPTPVGPPAINAVPTGIVFDGHQFLISTLTGFPFPTEKATIYKMGLSGQLTPYQQGFTSLVDIENDGNGNALVLRYGVFVLGPVGFTPKTGQLLRANGTGSSVLIDKLNLPTDIKISDNHTAYITSMGDNALLKVTF